MFTIRGMRCPSFVRKPPPTASRSLQNNWLGESNTSEAAITEALRLLKQLQQSWEVPSVHRRADWSPPSALGLSRAWLILRWLQVWVPLWGAGRKIPRDEVPVAWEVKGLRKCKSLFSVLRVFHISHVWTPPYGQVGGGGKERLPKAFRQIIDFAQDARPLLPAENGLWSGMRWRKDAGNLGPHSKSHILLKNTHTHLPLFQWFLPTLMEH